MIYTFIPYCPPAKGKNLAHAYNECMRIIGESDWACFIDHDAMFVTDNWYSQLEEIVASTDKLGVLTCMTNRIGNMEQLVFQKDSKESLDHDIHFHRKIGMDIYTAEGCRVRDAVSLISGVVLLTSKYAWNTVGGFRGCFVGVDNDYDQRIRKAGFRTCIADGIYVYHWYRAALQETEFALKPRGYDPKNFLPPI